MNPSTIALSVLLVCALSGLDTVDCSRQDVLKAFQSLKATGASKQQRKLIAGGSELFVSLQSELILSQEPYIQQTIDDETTVRDSLAAAPDSACAGYVHTGTDALMTLAGISFGNCVARIDDEMFAGLYPAQDSAAHQEYARASLLGSIRGLNIFTDPATVQARIEEKLSAPVVIEGMGSIGELSVDLRAALQACLSDARTLLRQSMKATSTQADSVCAKSTQVE